MLAGRPANFHRCCCRLALVSSESFRLLSAEPHLRPQLALTICHGPLTTLLGWRARHGLIPVRAIDLLRGLVSSNACCQTQFGVCTFGGTFCALSSEVFCLCTPFCWTPLTTGNAVARLTQHARPRLPSHTSLYHADVEKLAATRWSMWNLQETSTRHLYETLRPPRAKTCAMREARSSSSPEAAAISFTYSRYGYVH